MVIWWGGGEMACCDVMKGWDERIIDPPAEGEGFLMVRY